MKDLYILVKYFPVELFIVVITMGIASGPQPWGDVSSSGIGLILACALIGIVRGYYFAHYVGSMTRDFDDSSAPDFESETGAVDPWQSVCDHLVAACEYPPERPEVTAYSLGHLSRLIASIGEVSMEVSGVLPDHGKGSPALYEIKRVLSEAGSTCVRTGAILKNQVVWIKRARVPESAEVGAFSYEPTWEGTGPIDHAPASLILMELTNAMRDLAALGLSAGLPVSEAFSRLIAHTDDVRNPYGLIERNPVTGEWPRPRGVDYTAMLDGAGVRQ